MLDDVRLVVVVLALVAAGCATVVTGTTGNGAPKVIQNRASQGLDLVASQTSSDSNGDSTSAYLFIRQTGHHPVNQVGKQMQTNGWTMVPAKSGVATGNYAGYYATVESIATFDKVTAPSLDASTPTTAAKATVVIEISGP
jgi:hypothetical protein